MGASYTDAVVDEYFARQYGVVTFAQATKGGLTPRMIQQRVESGRWRQIARGIYAITSSPPTWRQQLAAVLLVPPRAVAAGRSAAHLHGFQGFGIPPRPEILVPRTGNARTKLARVERSTFFNHVATTRVDGFEVTTPAETVAALSNRYSKRIPALLDDTIANRSADLGEYTGILDRIAGGRVKGSALLRELVEERSPGAYQPPMSELERLSRRLVDRPEVPTATHQHPILGSAGPMIVDTFISLWGLVLEVDGRNYHTRKADFERDRRRDNAAVAQGFVVLRFTWRMVVDDFDYCLETLLATGHQRSPR